MPEEKNSCQFYSMHLIEDNEHGGTMNTGPQHAKGSILILYFVFWTLYLYNNFFLL